MRWAAYKTFKSCTAQQANICLTLGSTRSVLYPTCRPQPARHPPADATRMSGPVPIFLTASSTAASVSERRRTSHCTKVARRPSASTACTTSDALSSLAMSGKDRRMVAGHGRQLKESDEADAPPCHLP